MHDGLFKVEACCSFRFHGELLGWWKGLYSGRGRRCQVSVDVDKCRHFERPSGRDPLGIDVVEMPQHLISDLNYDMV